MLSLAPVSGSSCSHYMQSPWPMRRDSSPGSCQKMAQEDTVPGLPYRRPRCQGSMVDVCQYDEYHPREVSTIKHIDTSGGGGNACNVRCQAISAFLLPSSHQEKSRWRGLTHTKFDTWSDSMLKELLVQDTVNVL